MLEARDLSIGYAHSTLYRDLNFRLASGELVALLGLNGCGKSTLLRTLCGLQKPLNGTVYIDEEDIRRLSNKHRARKVAMTLTERISVPHLTVQELVSWSRNPYLGFSACHTAQDEQLITQSIEQVQMTHLAARPLLTLSDGERTRASIAAALCQDTPYILLDEPTAHLDVRNRRTVMQLLARLAHDLHKGILLSTHEFELACHTADRLWVLAPDSQVWANTPAALRANGILDAVFAE